MSFVEEMGKQFVEKLIRKVNPLGNINPIGSCFDAVGHQAMLKPRPRLKVCHGLVRETFGPTKGRTIAHAWIEVDGMAYDCVWGFKLPSSVYRQEVQARNVVEYPRDEFIRRWEKTDFPGPWDKTIFAHTSDGRGKK